MLSYNVEYVYSFVNGKINPSDILSKHWAHKDVWPLLKKLLFWRGDTLNLHNLLIMLVIELGCGRGVTDSMSELQ